MPSAANLKVKQAYNDKLCKLLDNHDRAFLVHADNVGSRQFMDIRAALRPDSYILMGKNTMMRKCIREHCERSGDDSWLAMGEKLVGNVGIIFTSGDLGAIREKVKGFVVPAPARMNAIAPVDVIIPAGPTGMEPSQTGFFQVLNIATKINKGAVEILADVVVCKTGEKVTSSAATLLAKMGFTPFFYGLEMLMVYDKGSIFDVKVLEITDAAISDMFGAGLKNVAALSMAANYPTIAAVPHAIINGYKNVLAISIGTDYTFPLAQKVKDYLANPGAFASAAPAAAAPAGGAKAKAPEPEPEEEEEEGGFDLFD
mmetsp:Transcript_38174/g.94696  ORF Transcript_38174/g.94696 Transcript_38174/m.94696 type:complete len:314 (-) Transcript_38174:177-1118(-)|eukprot:CAMPEP_0197592186 /NCGR_PEP_ID=MMETSP1326-20131121/14879_1 /TAXON_ID=1155430 /ORGANISM="Genus nov. species nov., Strain RCC2288" /LENGTH=313 /DNA_ID=CAMNT_0043157855 /DNA_START=197 /DNA_END=1138 /DNA_ORIENTATION=-